jgi:hypothetical protein
MLTSRSCHCCAITTPGRTSRYDFDRLFTQSPAPPIAILTTTALSHPHLCLPTIRLNLSTPAVLPSLDFHTIANRLSILASLIIFASASSLFLLALTQLGKHLCCRSSRTSKFLDQISSQTIAATSRITNIRGCGRSFRLSCRACNEDV